MTVRKKCILKELVRLVWEEIRIFLPFRWNLPLLSAERSWNLRVSPSLSNNFGITCTPAVLTASFLSLSSVSAICCSFLSAYPADPSLKLPQATPILGDESEFSVGSCNTLGVCLSSKSQGLYKKVSRLTHCGLFFFKKCSCLPMLMKNSLKTWAKIVHRITIAYNIRS